VTSRQAAVVNVLGLHARAAARFVSLASTFDSQVQVAVGARAVDGTSILGLLRLGASQGAVVTITATGDDADEAVAALVDLTHRGFEEE
jgi:phosphocarrier protein